MTRNADDTRAEALEDIARIARRLRTRDLTATSAAGLLEGVHARLALLATQPTAEPEADASEDIVAGELCFAGQRIPVRAVLSFAQAGYSAERIQREYPTLSLLQIEGAMALAAPSPGRGEEG